MIRYLLFFIIFLTVPNTVFALPNDPNVEQWSYEITGVYDAWDITTGSSDVVVAIIDNGFDFYHADLIDNTWQNEDEIDNNGIDDDNNGYIDDRYGWNFVQQDIDGDGMLSEQEALGSNNPRPSVQGIFPNSIGMIHHGTIIAGLIGAKGDNNLGIAGLNWDVSLMNLKIIGNNGNGSLQQIDAAIYYAVDNGADVISMSIVGDLEEERQQGMMKALEYAAAHDVVVVAAAGNDRINLNVTPRYPICLDTTSTPMVIGTSAIQKGRRFALFSNYGSNCIDITAPGTEIFSTVRYAPSVGLTDYFDGPYQGTSFAVPFISGTAALIRSVRPDLSAESIIESILSTTSKTPSEDELLYTNLFGAGLLQVDQALAYAMELPQEKRNGIYISYQDTSFLFSKQAQLLHTSNNIFRYTDTTNKRTVLYDVNSPMMHVTLLESDRTYSWMVSQQENNLVQGVWLFEKEKIARVLVERERTIEWYTEDGWLLQSMVLPETVWQITPLEHTDGNMYLTVVFQTSPTQVQVEWYDHNGVLIYTDTDTSFDTLVSATLLQEADGIWLYGLTESAEGVQSIGRFTHTGVFEPFFTVDETLSLHEIHGDVSTVSSFFLGVEDNKGSLIGFDGTIHDQFTF